MKTYRKFLMVWRHADTILSALVSAHVALNDAQRDGSDVDYAIGRISAAETILAQL